jgi:hypothetical protein
LEKVIIVNDDTVTTSLGTLASFLRGLVLVLAAPKRLLASIAPLGALNCNPDSRA